MKINKVMQEGYTELDETYEDKLAQNQPYRNQSMSKFISVAINKNNTTESSKTRSLPRINFHLKLHSSSKSVVRKKLKINNMMGIVGKYSNL